MKSKIIILMIAILLVTPIIMARTIGDVNKIDNIKSIKYTIEDRGIYLNDVKIVNKKDAEVWIDRKVGNTYHVDSLVDDVLIDLKLFYNIQPDTINYISHNGKYKQIYTYADWTWEEKCNPENYCGGYVILEVTLELGTGSNNFVDAITGATWQNDGITITLTEDTDFTVSGTTFTIININYGWNELTATYDFTTSQTRDDFTNIQGNYSVSLLNISIQFPSIGTIIGIIFLLIILIALLIFVIRRMMGVTAGTGGGGSSKKFSGSNQEFG